MAWYDRFLGRKEEDIYEAVESLCHRFFTYDKLSISFLVDQENL